MTELLLVSARVGAGRRALAPAMGAFLVESFTGAWAITLADPTALKLALPVGHRLRPGTTSAHSLATRKGPPQHAVNWMRQWREGILSISFEAWLTQAHSCRRLRTLNQLAGCVRRKTCACGRASPMAACTSWRSCTAEQRLSLVQQQTTRSLGRDSARKRSIKSPRPPFAQTAVNTLSRKRVGEQPREH